MPFVIVEAQTNQGFTDQTDLPGAGLTLRFEHKLTSLPNGKTQITHQLTITGPNAETAAGEIGPMIVADFPEAMTALARLAEQSK